LLLVISINFEQKSLNTNQQMRSKLPPFPRDKR
jgi:hypothetical protein